MIHLYAAVQTHRYSQHIHRYRRQHHTQTYIPYSHHRRQLHTRWVRTAQQRFSACQKPFSFCSSPYKIFTRLPGKESACCLVTEQHNHFLCYPIKKLQFRQFISKMIIAQNARLSIGFHNIFLQINLNFSTGFYSFRCNFLFLAVCWSGRTGLPGFPSFRPAAPPLREGRASPPPRPLPQVPYFSNFFPCKDCLFMLLFFIIEADFFLHW